MTNPGPIHVEVAYTATVTQGTGRTPWTAHLATTAPVLVPSVAGDEARVVIEAAWPAGGRPPRMTWREHGGSLWRPLVAPNGEALDAPDGFALGIAQGRAQAGGRAMEWPDYPFAVHAPGGPQHGRVPFGAMREGDPGLRVRSDNREAAVAAAQRKAAGDLLLVDGVLHMRSRPPVWAVGRRKRLQVSPGHLRLAIPDFADHDDWLGSFPLDRREEALAFAAANAERVGAIAWMPARGGRDGVVAEDAEVRHGGMVFADTRADDLLRMFEEVESNLRGAELKMFERRFLKAYGDLAAIADAIADDGPEPAWPDGAEAAVRAVVDAGKPEWAETWFYAAEVVEGMRSLAQRCEITDRLTVESDAAEIATLGR